MKAYEFAGKVTSEGKLELPDTVQNVLPGNREVRVIVLVSEPGDIEERTAWARLTTEQFLSGYSEADAVYDRM